MTTFISSEAQNYHEMFKPDKVSYRAKKKESDYAKILRKSRNLLKLCLWRTDRHTDNTMYRLDTHLH